MKKSTDVATPAQTLGLDVGDRWIHIARLEGGSEPVEERLRCTRGACRQYFERLSRARVVLEVGTHSRWLSRLLEETGHEVIVANAGRLPAIFASNHKSDRRDALELARLARFDPKILHPIEHRPEPMQEDLSILHMRDALVRSRTLLINQARGLMKAAGLQPKRCSSESFKKRIAGLVAPCSSVDLLSEQIDHLTTQIKRIDQRVLAIARERYPQTKLLRQIKGVGPITSLAFVLILFDPKRFARSRDVGPYLGLVPRKHQSGDSDPQLRITKAGNAFLRRLLVQAAQYILGPFGKDCELRRYGERLAASGGKAAKKRAVVAVARKLAVLLHHLWLSAEVYRPLEELPSSN